ncbi:DNA-processing protein DprA, partial [Candidatus Saccharibacteria bacterium]|nr:DNA-processing protein DprA [Candidatus Saccharibacteria bacterium]
MLTLSPVSIPEQLQRLPQPPKQLFVEGPLEALLSSPCVAIVGSRKVSPYGRQVTELFARTLAERGVVIVSGLAFGIDSIAHRAALEAGGKAIAVLPTPLDRIYPASHRQLAADILERGGALVSEYAPDDDTYRSSFVARNRLIAGLADATLIPEAALKSGSLHTARFTLELGKDVLAVPGNITSPVSEGTNNLIRVGATPITSVGDLLFALNLPVNAPQKPKGQTPAEQTILDLLAAGVCDGAELLQQS